MLRRGTVPVHHTVHQLAKEVNGSCTDLVELECVLEDGDGVERSLKEPVLKNCCRRGNILANGWENFFLFRLIVVSLLLEYSLCVRHDVLQKLFLRIVKLRPAEHALMLACSACSFCRRGTGVRHLS